MTSPLNGQGLSPSKKQSQCISQSQPLRYWNVELRKSRAVSLVVFEPLSLEVSSSWPLHPTISQRVCRKSLLIQAFFTGYVPRKTHHANSICEPNHDSTHKHFSNPPVPRP